MVRRSILLLLALAGLSACSDSTEETAAPPTVESAPPTPAAPATFEYTEEVSTSSIPAFPVKGMASGREIEIRSIFFQPRFDQWGVSFSTAELATPTSIQPGGDSETVNLTDLPQELGVGVFEHGIDESGGGYFQIKQLEDPTRTTSWNTRLAYVLEITKWEVQPWTAEGRMFQDAGRASGRVVAVFRGREGGFQNSWIAGTFEDAVVRYMGRPRWIPDPNAPAEPAQ
ncbi:MAG: hypothetical protein H6721_22015 [Sandaracinus sp.]|nr:hypothetical protein [Sandaracinus sp.]